MFAQVGLMLLLSGSPQVQYDPQEALHAEQLQEQVGGAESCLRRAILAELQMGERDQKRLVQFATQTCGSGLHFFMGDVLGRPKKEIDAFLNVMAYQQLARVLAESR